MFNLDLQWKTFNVDLAAAEAWVKANSTGCTGTSGNTVWQLHFTEEPAQEVKDAIHAYWNALTDKSAEAASYLSNDQLKAAIDAAKADAVTKTWNQLSAGQKKLIMGMTPTRADLGL